MGIFSTSSSFDQIVEKATNETNTKEDWALIMEVCDKVTTSPTAPKECLRSIIKRLFSPDPHVQLQAITLLDACVSNCGMPFHLEVASREFEQKFREFISKTNEKTIRDKTLGFLQRWATNEFSRDPSLDLIPSLYNKFKAAGYDFPSDTPSKGGSGRKSSGGHHHHHKSKESSSSSSSAAQQEADDLAKAIELSLKEAGGGSGSPKSKSLYPSSALGSGLSSGGSGGLSMMSEKKQEKEPRKVRALYDFEAAEDNELTFFTGEIVHVIDDSDPNWWQGSNQRGTGLFPSNFVTADLSADLTPKENGSKKQVQFNEEIQVKTVESEVEAETAEVSEERIDRALLMLHEADPTGEIPDPPELAILEEQVGQMGPLIDQGLDKIDRRHAQLTRLGSDLVEALNMYHNLMRDGLGLGMPPSNQLPPLPQGQFPLPPQMSLPNLSMSQGGQQGQYQQPNMNSTMAGTMPLQHQQQQQPPYIPQQGQQGQQGLPQQGYYDPNGGLMRPPYSAPPSTGPTMYMGPPPSSMQSPIQQQPHYG